MNTSGFPKPINVTQERFHDLCKLGGGAKGGPARTKVQRLLKESGESLNTLLAYDEVDKYLKAFAHSIHGTSASRSACVGATLQI